MYEPFGLDHLAPLLSGAWMTAILCLCSTVIGGIAGFALGVLGTLPSKASRMLSGMLTGFVRGVPVLMIIFFCYFGIPALFPYLDVTPFAAAVLALSIFAAAYIGEIVRGSIAAISKGQSDAADALAMSLFQKYRHVLLPQAVRIMLPSGIGFLLILLKDSSLVSVVGLIELARAGTIVSNLTNEPIATYLAVGAIYFVLCFAIAQAGRVVEAKLGVSRRSTASRPSRKERLFAQLWR